jgi:mRNA interferase RelE/StbE
MASSRIEFKRSAEKTSGDWAANICREFSARSKKLESNPFPLGVRKLAGSDLTYRIRMGDYRIIYQVPANNLILITRVRHRREVYRD